MFVDSVNVFPKFRKQFIQVLLLGVLDMVKDVSQRPLGFAAYSNKVSLKKGTIFFSECLRTLLDAF